MSDGRDAFSSPALKRSDSTAGSRNESSSEFQTVGPATEKARRPCLMCRDETAEYWSMDNGELVGVIVRIHFK